MKLPRASVFFPPAFALILTLATPTHAETGYEGWLRYAPMDDDSVRKSYKKILPAVVVTLGNSEMEQSAQAELIRGVRGLLDRTERVEAALPDENAILLGTVERDKKSGSDLQRAGGFDNGRILSENNFGWRPSDSRRYRAERSRRALRHIHLVAKNGVGRNPLPALDDEENPYAPIRVINQWDNLNGTIERGYAGGSIFWLNGHIVPDLTRAGDYARLLASLGIDGCSINNVNADPHAIDSEHIPELARVAAAFRPWGVKLFVCINFGSPKSIGGLDTFDPLDPRVIDFWNKKVEEIYAAIPDFGGFIMKADSEGELGPSAYGRTHADAANVVARPLKAHGGIVFYRGFVYNHHADWRNLKLDRAKAAYDNFHRSRRPIR